MFNLEKEKAYDKMMTKLAEAHGDLMVAQGAAYIAKLHSFNDQFIDLLYQLENFRKELAKAYSAIESDES